MRLGSNDLTKEKDCDDCDPAVEYEIEKVIRHSGYSISEGNDIGLLKLKEKVTMNHNVGTICLPLKDENFYNEIEHEKMVVMGFGRTETQKRSNVLLKTIVPFISLEECEIYYEKTIIKNFNNGYLCAGDGKSDSCKGRIEHFNIYIS